MLKEEGEIDGDPWRRRLLAIQEQAAACWAAPVERRDAAEHRQHILAVARRLVTEHGVDGVSMQQIARAAGVGQGTLYRRYAHKGALCMALLTENVARAQEDVKTYLASCGPSTPARAQLEYVLSRHVAFNEENAPLLSAAFEAACGHHRAAHYGHPFYTMMRQTMETLLERAVARGETPPRDTAYMADAILAALAIDLYIHQRAQRGFTPDRIMAAIRQLYIDDRCTDAGRAG